MIISAKERLKAFYAQFSGDEQVLILINADPDAIASAMAIKRLLWRRVAGVTITRVNVIERPDNLAMIRLTGVRLVHIGEVNMSRFSRFVLVDSQPSHHERFAGVPFHIIIDHHPDTQPKAAFTDIRPKYGATASMMTEYLLAARIKPSAKLATALIYAIKTDTSNFEREALIEDIRAFQFMFRHANTHMVRKIEQSELKLEFLKSFRIALERMRRRKNKVFAHIGNVPSPDVLVLIADYFMRVNTVSWSVVSGRYERKLIIVFRNDGIRKNAGKLARDSFGQFGSAGGHKSMARAEIPLSEVPQRIDCQDPTKVGLWVMRQIERSLARPKPKEVKEVKEAKDGKEPTG
ncbi:MAG: DHH family phosphoesterase [Pseudomonadota bacterium]